MELDQAGAGLPELPVGGGEPAQAGLLAARDGAQAGAALLAPGKHHGRVQGTLRGGAVAGRFAGAGFQFVEGAFEQGPAGEQGVDLAAEGLDQMAQELAPAAGLSELGAKGGLAYFMFHTTKT